MKALTTLPAIEFLQFAGKPLPICGLGAIEKLSEQEASQRISIYRGNTFTWTENIFIPDEWALNKIDQLKLDEITEKLIPLDMMCACFLNAETGYGVYTTQTISKGSVILYSGIIKEFKHEKLHYGMQAGPQYVIDGATMSGFADLFQDLYEPSLDASDNPRLLAHNNFTAKTLTLSCGAITLLEASIDIPPLTQCGVNYGTQYWKMQYKHYQLKKHFYPANTMK
jgi:hypothetical protein